MHEFESFGLYQYRGRHFFPPRFGEPSHINRNLVNYFIFPVNIFFNGEKNLWKPRLEEEFLDCTQKTRTVKFLKFSPVQFSHSVVSDFLRQHESQHTRPPCPSPTPGVHLNSCALSQ